MRKMSNKLVSIVIPVYNAEKYLKACLDSICKQSYKNLQIIIVDDCSKDNSLSIIKQYYSLDKRIEVVEHNKCKGVSAARNSGIKIAKGRYICFVDADDEIETYYVEKLLRIIETEKVQVVYGRHKYLYNNNTSKRSMRINPGIYETKSIEPIVIDDGTLTGILFGSACGAIYDLNMIHSKTIFFVETIKRNEDGIFNIDVLCNTQRICVTDYDGYLYRQWKEKKTQSIFEPDIELDKATNYIKKHYSSLENYCNQMMCRRASVVFWNAIRIKNCKGGFFKNQRRLRKYLKKIKLKECYSYLELERINKYKRFLILLLKNNNSIIFSILMMYIYPFFQKKR